MSPREIEQLYRELSEALGAVSKRVEAMSWEMRAEKYAEIFWYSKKNLKDRLAKGWSLPERIRKQIRNGEIKSRQGDMSEKELKVLLRLSF